MDIQVASNFERALFEASGRDAVWIREAMDVFARTRKIEMPAGVRSALAARYEAMRIDDSETLATIRRIRAETGILIDPHTAVGVAAARAKTPAKTPVVVLSTAHPAKFPDAIRKATGEFPPLPPRLSHIMQAGEKMDVLANDKSLVRAHIAAKLGHP